MDRIAIDGYRLCGIPGSIGTYTYELVKGLVGEGCRITLMLPRDEPNEHHVEILRDFPSVECQVAEPPINPDTGYWSLLRWGQELLPGMLDPARHKALISVYHQTAYRVPAGIGRVTVIHDCCGLRTDCGYKALGRTRWKHWALLKSAASFAESIVPISEATRNDFIRRFPGALDRVVSPVLNQVSRDQVNKARADGVLARLGLEPASYLLSIGGPGPRKGMDVALRAYSLYRRRGGQLPLVLFGRDQFDYVKWGLDPQDLGQVRWLGRVDDSQRDTLYAGAACFLFLSRCEGFGYPMVEAMRQGCPVVAWRETTAREVMGDSPGQLATLDYAEAASQMAEFADLTEEARVRLAGQLIERSLVFSKNRLGPRFLESVGVACQRARIQEPTAISE